MNAMSFAVGVRNELSRIMPRRQCCARAELAGILRAAGSLHLRGRGAFVEVETTSTAAARKVFLLMKAVLGAHAEILVKKGVRLKKRDAYLIRAAQEGTGTVFVLPGMAGVAEPEDSVDAGRLPGRRCCRRAYLRGVFLTRGSVSDPRRTYHLEMRTLDEGKADELCRLMRADGLAPGVSRRRDGLIVYLKDADHIASFLGLMGAHAALLDFEDVRVLRDVRNRVNRLVNCDTANVAKSVEAALGQVRDIRLIERVKGFSRLPSGLRRIAELRVEHPEVSLRELGEMLVPRLGKSGVSHRLRRLNRLAEALRKVHGDGDVQG